MCVQYIYVFDSSDNFLFSCTDSNNQLTEAVNITAGGTHRFIDLRPNSYYTFSLITVTDRGDESQTNTITVLTTPKGNIIGVYNQKVGGGG